MQDSIYHMTFKLHFISKFAPKGHDFAIRLEGITLCNLHI